MTPSFDSWLAELDREAATTRRVLERVPGSRLGWKPHAKSMSLGQLGLHVATIPGAVARFLLKDGLDIDGVSLEQPAAQSASELLPAAVMRSIMLNHWYHHRGQLSVYLRLLEIPVPSIYGPSADENPFAS